MPVDARYKIPKQHPLQKEISRARAQVRELQRKLADRPRIVPGPEDTHSVHDKVGRWPEQLGRVYVKWWNGIPSELRAQRFEDWLFKILRDGDYHLLPRKINKPRVKSQPKVRRKFTFEHS